MLPELQAAYAKGENDFIDGIHPNARGNQRIAE
jgi:hypothetical protein